MCGIVGYVGQRPAVEVLLQGLKLLEYRGYDSTGVAFFSDPKSEKIEIRKSEGKLERVEKILKDFSSRELQSVRCGIGHTRWATHGKPTTQNAHPHRTGHVVLVHNGIIENYQSIKSALLSRGHQPLSETDSELLGFLILEQMEQGKKLSDAVRESFKQIEGACSVVVMSEREPGVLVGVRNGSPLVAAFDPAGGVFLASDAQPLLIYTQDVYFLEQGDLVVCDHSQLTFHCLHSAATQENVKRAPTRLDWSPEKLDQQGYAHYMLKEIYEQPTVLMETLNGLLDRVRMDPFPLASQPGVEWLDQAKELTLIACGTSYYAAMVGKYWIEKWAKIPVQVELASEYRYREPVHGAGTVLVGISQSGETADTLAVIREARTRGIRTLAVTNVRGSTIAREAHSVFYTYAGPEVGVAATKSFLTQLMTLLIFAGALRVRKTDPSTDSHHAILFDQSIRIPHLLADYLSEDAPAGESLRGRISSVVSRLQNIKGFFFIGRGYSYPIALEGALKLKEIAYVHAEGYAAGELKHGPIAMIDEAMAVVVIAPQDLWKDKTISNLQEVKARGARIVGIGHSEDSTLRSLSDEWIALPAPLPHFDEALSPFFTAPVVQLFSYEMALLKGTDVDKPRNLAKSVTVE